MDRNAIKVALDEGDIGFIDKHLAQLIAPYMDSGLKFKAKIVELEHHKNSTEIKLMISVEQ